MNLDRWWIPNVFLAVLMWFSRPVLVPWLRNLKTQDAPKHLRISDEVHWCFDCFVLVWPKWTLHNVDACIHMEETWNVWDMMNKIDDRFGWLDLFCTENVKGAGIVSQRKNMCELEGGHLHIALQQQWQQCNCCLTFCAFNGEKHWDRYPPNYSPNDMRVSRSKAAIANHKQLKRTSNEAGKSFIAKPKEKVKRKYLQMVIDWCQIDSSPPMSGKLQSNLTAVQGYNTIAFKRDLPTMLICVPADIYLGEGFAVLIACWLCRGSLPWPSAKVAAENYIWHTVSLSPVWDNTMLCFETRDEGIITDSAEWLVFGHFSVLLSGNQCFLIVYSCICRQKHVSLPLSSLVRRWWLDSPWSESFMQPEKMSWSCM